MPPPPPPPPVGVEPFDIPPPPPPATTNTSTAVIPAGTVHEREANCAEVVGDVGAVANTTMHAPEFERVAVTPAALSTVEAQAPVPMAAAWAPRAGKVIDAKATTSEHTRTFRIAMGAT